MTMDLAKTAVVLTAPTEGIARVYRLQLSQLAATVPQLQQCQLFCVADPEGVRVGSGGGTLHALSELQDTHGMALDSFDRILIIHSGGDSKRAPLCSLCGKAWLSLNSTVASSVASPLVLLLQELDVFLRDLPVRSIVVACSDVLLRLTHGSQPLQPLTDDGVYVVTVRAPVETAKNHGVILSNAALALPGVYAVAGVDQYLQKPSLADMDRTGASFESDVDGEGKVALIDTGVVVFVGKGASALCKLLTLPAVRRPLIRFELYSDVLLACRVGGADLNEELYMQRIGANTSNHLAMGQIYATFKDCELKVIYSPTGRFYHLGTSNEILTICAGTALPESVRRVHSVCFNSSSSLDESVVLIGSIVSAAQTSAQQGGCCLVDHSILTNCKLPACGIISHVDWMVSKHIAVFLDRCLVQQVHLLPSNRREAHFALQPCCIIHLNLEDDPKLGLQDLQGRVQGMCWPQFMERFGAVQCDIWDGDGEKTLWNARLFPAFATRGDQWLAWNKNGKLVHVEPQTVLGSILGKSSSLQATAEWKNLQRLSLEDVLAQGDAEAMFAWRAFMNRTCGELAAEPPRSLQAIEQAHIIHSSWVFLRHHEQHLTCSQLSAVVLTFWSYSNFIPQFLSNRTLLNTAANEISRELRLVFGQQLDSTVSAVIAFVDSICAVHRQGATLRFLKLWLCSDDHLAMIRCLLHANVFVHIPDKSHARWLLWLGLLAPSTPICDPSGHDFDFVQVVSVVPEEHDIFHKGIWDESSKVMRSIAMRMKSIQGAGLIDLLEESAHALVFHAVRHSIGFVLGNARAPLRFNGGKPGQCCLATAPARIDLAGGWSDTPPICYDLSGAVLNVAVNVDGNAPLRCAVRCIGDCVIRLAVFRKVTAGGDQLELLGEETCTSHQDFKSVAHNQSICALLKASLVVLGLVNPNSDDPILTGGLEIVCLSNLPTGSGMGGSSILAATVLQAIATALHSQLSNELVIYLVGQVEQVLQTCGGWQDQVGGCYGGFKIARSAAVLPLRVEVENIPSAEAFHDIFNRRVLLVYTGTQRLAKNTLINALKQYALTSSAIHSQDNIMSDLVANAEMGAQILRDGNSSAEVKFARLAEVVNRYWDLKIAMAPGSNPPYTQHILEYLKPLCLGISLCGAGAGGFAVLLCNPNTTTADVENRVAELNVKLTEVADNGATSVLSVHSVAIDNSGLEVHLQQCNWESMPLSTLLL